MIDVDLAFPARLDTGAAGSTLHATDVQIDAESVRFVVEGTGGERVPLERPLYDVARIRSAHGVDARPRVLLRLSLGDVEKELPVSLRDRSSMQYPLLIGRDFLAGDFVVDVSREPIPAPPADLPSTGGW